MAVLPFAWFVFNGFLHISPEISWLLTSIIGIVLYTIAAYLMNSQVVAYFTIAFIISLTCSMSACFQWALIWYFVAIMGVLVIFGLLQLLTRKSHLGIFTKPVEVSERWLPIVTACASFCAISTAEPYHYVIIFALCALQAGCNWLNTHDTKDALVSRLSVQIMLIAVFTIFDKNIYDIGFVLSILSLIHAAISILLQRKNKEDGIELTLFVSMLGVSVLSIICMAIVGPFEKVFIYTAIYCVLSAIFCIFAKNKLQQSAWGFGGLAALTALPFFLNETVDKLFSFQSADLCFDIVYFFVMILALIIWIHYRRAKKYKFTDIFNAFAITTLVTSSIAIFTCSALIPSLVISPDLTIASVWIHAPLLLLLAFLWLIVGRSLNFPVLKEIAFYIGLAFICRIIDYTFHSMAHPDASFWVTCISLVWGIGLIIMGNLAPNLYNQPTNRTTKQLEQLPSQYVRQMLGVLTISLSFGGVALTTTVVGWSIVFLITETIFLIIGVINKWKWMWIIGMVGDILAVLWFTRELSYIWFIFIGIALFVIVIRQLYKNTKKDQK